HRERNEEESLKELNLKYYELMMTVIPEDVYPKEKRNYEEFINYVTTDKEFKEILEFQFGLLSRDLFQEFLILVKNNPDWNLDQIQNELVNIERSRTNILHETTASEALK